MRFDTVNAPLSELPQRAAQAARVRCEFCASGRSPTKLKRQWVHHSPATGRIIVCTAHNLKPSGS